MLSVDAYKEKNFVVTIIVETPGEDIELSEEVRPAFVRFICILEHSKESSLFGAWQHV